MSGITVRRLAGVDRTVWNALWAGYLSFYGTEVEAETTDVVFQRLVDPGWTQQHGWLAERDGEAVGFAHVALQHSTWALAPDGYLEDLFVAPTSRAQGVGGALLAHLTVEAAEHGWRQVHWLTDADNATARLLYDRVGELQDQVRYVARPDDVADVSSRGS